jgi:predicted enzyme related to lactoylglutathione lyase
MVHFDIPSDDVDRAKKFYADIFVWTFSGPPGYPDYFLFETEGLAGKPGAGGSLGRRIRPDQRIVTCMGVDSIDAYAKKVERPGGRVIMPKRTVPKFGYLAPCTDTEGNSFDLWQDDPLAQ